MTPEQAIQMIEMLERLIVANVITMACVVLIALMTAMGGGK